VDLIQQLVLLCDFSTVMKALEVCVEHSGIVHNSEHDVSHDASAPFIDAVFHLR
jgi:hypothetical protein